MSVKDTSGSTANWLVFGLVASIAAAAAVGAVLYRVKHASEQVTDRDVKEIIRECHSTIQQMDSALEGIRATGTKVGLKS